MEKRIPDNLAIPTPIQELDKYVPKKVLQDLLDEFSEGIEIPKSRTKESLLNEVRGLLETKEIPVERINTIVRSYKFAGRVSVCWGIPLERVSLSKPELDRLILDKFPSNPFEKEIQPQLSQKPAFNKAEWLSDDLLRLEFVYSGKQYEVEDNYQRRVIIPTKRINSYIRVLETTFVVETRSSIRESKLLYEFLFLLIGIEIIPMTFSDRDIEFLKRELKGKIKNAKRKRFGGDIDTVSVSASPELDDLENSEDYNNHFSDGELKETRLEFNYLTKLNKKIVISLHVSHQGNIWFMSDVPEEIIEYVFTIVREIKFLPSLQKLGLSSKLSNLDRDQIQSLINAIREQGYSTRFNPRIYLTLGFEIDERKWIEAISKFVQLGYLTERFELVCPACHETIKVYFEYKDIPLDETIDCDHCGHTFEVSEKDILLTYSFKEPMETELSRDLEPFQTEDSSILAKI